MPVRSSARLLWTVGTATAVLGATLWLWRPGSVPAVLTVDSTLAAEGRPVAAASAPAPRLELTATSRPALDVPPVQHPALDRMLAEDATAVAEGLILRVSAAGQSGGGSLTIQALTDAPRVRLAVGDTPNLHHDPVRHQRTFGASTPHEDLLAGQVRELVIQRDFFGRYALLLAGPVRRRVDFDALKAACDWDAARPFIGRADCSVVEAEWSEGKGAATSRGSSRVTLRVLRTLWSTRGWTEGLSVEVMNSPRPVEILGRLQAAERGEPLRGGSFADARVLPPELRGRRVLVVAEHTGAVHILRMAQAR